MDRNSVDGRLVKRGELLLSLEKQNCYTFVSKIGV